MQLASRVLLLLALLSTAEIALLLLAGSRKLRKTLRKEKRVDEGGEGRAPPINPTLPSTARSYRFSTSARKERAPPPLIVGEIPIKARVAPTESWTEGG